MSINHPLWVLVSRVSCCQPATCLALYRRSQCRTSAFSHAPRGGGGRADARGRGRRGGTSGQGLRPGAGGPEHVVRRCVARVTPCSVRGKQLGIEIVAMVWPVEETGREPEELPALCGFREQPSGVSYTWITCKTLGREPEAHTKQEQIVSSVHETRNCGSQFWMLV